MSTFLALVSKLPPQIVVLSPRLQLTLAWANMLLQRPAAAYAALSAFGSAADQRGLSASELQAMRTEVDVFRAVVECYADRTAGVDELVAECLSRPDSVTPWVVAAAANVASFLELYRFDFDAARRWQHWAYRYHEQSSGPFSMVYGHCLVGIAANEQLDVAEAERCFREALRVANSPEIPIRIGWPPHSWESCCTSAARWRRPNGSSTRATSWGQRAAGGVHDRPLCHRCAHQGGARRP